MPKNVPLLKKPNKSVTNKLCNKQEFRINKIIMLLKKNPKNYHIELYVVHVLINSRNQIHSFR